MLDQTALLRLVKQYKDGQLAVVAFYRQLTEVITKQVGCSRASIWLFADAAKTQIHLLDGFDSVQQQHFYDAVLTESDYQPYFQAMRAQGGVQAPDALTHPATGCFADSYFAKHQIVSLLDVGILQQGLLVGMFCCEQVETMMQWDKRQIDFLQQAGKLISFALLPQLAQLQAECGD